MWPRVDEASFENTAGSRRIVSSRDVVTRTLAELCAASSRLEARWALIGGQALIAYGVPRDTLDADALVEEHMLGDLATELVARFAWSALVYDHDTGDYATTAEAVVHYMEDPVLFDLGQERVMIPLRSAAGLLVELLAAQHPVEKTMVEQAALKQHFDTAVPVAPLGGILLVKAKADRIKDIAAIEQAAEHLPRAVIERAFAWADAHDPATAEDLKAVVHGARVRRAPVRTAPCTPRKK